MITRVMPVVRGKEVRMKIARERLPSARRSARNQSCVLQGGLHRRRGVSTLEEILVLAVMIPLAFAILTFCWSVSGAMYQIIRGFVLAPVL